jgi:MFS family permease
MSQRTGSSGWVGAVNLMNYLPVLLLVLFAGYFADTYDRRKVIVFSLSLQTLCALVLGLLVTFNADTNAAILIVVGVMGVALAMGFPAWLSVLPDLVSEDDMMSALSLSAAQFNLGRVIGPAIGIIVLRIWSPAGAFYLNAVSFLFVIVAVLLGRTKTPAGRLEPGRLRSHLVAGFRYVRARSWMIWVLVALGIGSFFGFSTLVLMPALARNVLHGGSSTYSLLLVMMGIGAAIGAPLVTWLDRQFPEKTVIKASLMALGLLLALMSASRWTWLSCIAAVGLGGAYLMLGSAANTVLQANSDRDMRGRVVSIYIMVYVGAFPLGGMLMGLLADRIDSTRITYLIAGICCVVGAAVFYLMPSLIREASSPEGIPDEIVSI